MASTKQPSIFLLFALISLSITINSSNATDCVGSGAISVYWGQHPNNDEGTLQATCATGNYDIVILESLIVFDSGRTPLLNLDNHCSGNSCSVLQSQIEYCQENNIKVFLSIGLVSAGLTTNTASLSASENVTKDLADYLLEKYLSGNSGPLGNVYLDGIDIADVSDSEHIKWDELVKLINASTTDRRIYLSASPQCIYPDRYLSSAINTGLVDYVWVEFYYQNPDCIYSNGNPSKLLSAWKTWTSRVPNSLIFLGLAASDTIAGYIKPDALISEVLPTVKEASNYGGVMIWDRYLDKINNYSPQIKDSVSKVCRCVCDESASTSFYGLPLRGTI
ncbi:acidic endochitinase-like [Gastrolobium bilobum]|uniref:acidic endochitinase-like n=1 Tax=Gastrolobium bilobum TaxID=150636 RepID=UPI002AB22C32|nr:acidic endochitinase-like [Gastrolobium bilobum]